MIRLRPNARFDIRSISAELEEGRSTTAVARRFLVGFENACRLLKRFPLMGVSVYAEHPSLQELRRSPIEHFSKYLIFYRVMESDIIIERVLHGARDLPLLLNAKQPN